MLFEKMLQHGLVALADLAQHPAAGLVHQVVRVGEEMLAEFERVIELPLADQRLRGDDGDALFPEAR